MKKILLGSGLVLFLLGIAAIHDCRATAYYAGAKSASTNGQYACQPPYLLQSSKPNIHFVLDYTTSMQFYSYIENSSGVYTPATNYYGYFKFDATKIPSQDLYYKYDTTTAVTGMSPTKGVWVENSACSNTNRIGTPDCVSGNLLNFLTTSKLDVLRKVLTGGRLSGTTTDVREHELEDDYTGNGVYSYASTATTALSKCSGSIAQEPTTHCRVDSCTAAKMNIDSPDPADAATAVIESSLSVAVDTTNERFTRSDVGGSFLNDGWNVGDTVVVGAGNSTAINSNNRGTWTVTAVSATQMTVSGNLQTSETHNAKFSRITYPANTVACSVLVRTVNIPMTVTSSTKKFTRTDGGSFTTDGWMVGMTFDSSGFRNAGNNSVNGSASTWTISAVTASDITVSAAATMVTYTVATNATLTQKLTGAYTRVQTTTPADDLTGIIQNIYPTSGATKADIEISFFNGGGVTYSPGGTNTAKNQLQSNYIAAINGSNGYTLAGSTNTGIALQAAERFFQADNSTATGIRGKATMPTGWPAAGSAAANLTLGNSTYDPFYDGAGNTAIPCRKSFILLASDGDWNTPNTSSKNDPVAPAYDMHTKRGVYDLRPNDSASSALPGYDPNMSDKQSVTTYSVYVLGDTNAGRNAMETVAIFGGFSDIDLNNLPYPFTTQPAAPPYTSDAASNLQTVSNTTGWPTSLGASADTSALFYPLPECHDGPSGRWDTGCAEWDTSPVAHSATPPVYHTNLPYNFFDATDGQKVADSILAAVNDMLERVSSGTAASILGNNDNAGSQLLQAMFYPLKTFEGSPVTKTTWLGELQSYWYFVDPTLSHVTIRDDTNTDKMLELKQDKIIEFSFADNVTTVNLFPDINGDGVKDTTTATQDDPDQVNALWRAGLSLFCRDESDRTIFTNDPTTTSATKLPFIYSDGTGSGSTSVKLADYLDVTSASAASDIIAYARGVDVDTSYRNRTIKKTTNCSGTSNTYTKTWKLGDIVNSTPKILTEVRLNSYNMKSPGGYGDSTYDKFINSYDYNARGMAFVGANDGMMHAFKTGSNFSGTSSSVVAMLKNANGSAPTNLGKEMWAFIPKNALPYLQYLTLNTPAYSHMYFVDNTPILADVSINPTKDPAVTCDDSSYSTCIMKTTIDSNNKLNYDTTGTTGGTSWRTVLIGGMGMGGATRASQAATTGIVITAASANTFTRTVASGSFLTDGWKPGMLLTASGFATTGNNGLFQVSNVTATVITCGAGAGLATETSPTTASLKETQNVKIPVTSPANLGFSSVFALDITQPNDGTTPDGTTPGATAGTEPKLLWEFSDPRLGFTTAAPALIRIKDATETVSNPQRRNGNWYVVLASGPTGPITAGAYKANADLPLTIFVLDLKSGKLLRTFNNMAPSSVASPNLNTNVDSSSLTTHTQFAAMPSYAFAGSLGGSAIDVDKANINAAGNYSDDAIYIGYAKGDPSPNPTAWNKGGVLRLLTNNDPLPANWKVSVLVDGIGPVTTAIKKLQDITANKLWLYFGTGRYYSMNDDITNRQSLFGVTDPCYLTSNTFDATCTTQVAVSSSGTAGASSSVLVDQSSAISAVDLTSKKGWFINLPLTDSTSTSYPKRVITSPIANLNGTVTFSTFAPSTNVCQFGGQTSVWEVKYDTGASGAVNLMGQLLIQLSTGAFQQINLATDFTLNLGRETTSYSGTPPRDEPSVSGNANHFPSKRILHIRER